MTADGLAPGQSWAIPTGDAWQARLDRCGRAHVISVGLSGHQEHGPRYVDCGKPPRSNRVVWFDWSGDDDAPPMVRRLLRRWHAFDRAHRVAAFHERLVRAAGRDEG